MIRAKLGKRWIAQVTINMADDEELLDLASRAGCLGVFIGFESPDPEGLTEVHKKFNIQRGRDFGASVRRIQRHGIMVVGSFIIGLDVDEPGIGPQIAETADRYGLDSLNVLILTPLPGTDLFAKMESEGRIVADKFPEDWDYYTLTFPVARYRQLSWADVINESAVCSRVFYSYPRIIRRTFRSLWRTRNPIGVLANLVSNLSYKNNATYLRSECRRLIQFRGDALALDEPAESQRYGGAEGPEANDQSGRDTINVIRNRFEELKQRVPPGGR